jgi:hypothetical protein
MTEKLKKWETAVTPTPEQIAAAARHHSPARLIEMSEMEMDRPWDPASFTISVTTEGIRQLVADGILVPHDPKAFEDALAAAEQVP